MTPANVGDIDMFEALIQGDEEVLYGDAAYESVKHRDLLEKMGKGNALMHRGNKHHPLPESRKGEKRRDIQASNACRRRLRIHETHAGLPEGPVHGAGQGRGGAAAQEPDLQRREIAEHEDSPGAGLGPHRFRARFFRRDRRKTRPEASENSLSGGFGAKKRPQPAGIENRPALRTGPLVAEGQGETRPLSPPWERARACPGLEPGVRGPH